MPPFCIAAEMLAQDKLDALASLFGKGPGRLNVQGATTLTDLYIRHYFHGEPFRPEAVRAVWRACAEPECARVRPEAERRLDGARSSG